MDPPSSASTELHWTTGLATGNSTRSEPDLDRTLVVPKTRSRLNQELVSDQDLDLFRCESSQLLDWSWYQIKTGSGFPNLLQDLIWFQEQTRTRTGLDLSQFET